MFENPDTRLIKWKLATSCLAIDISLKLHFHIDRKSLATAKMFCSLFFLNYEALHDHKNAEYKMHVHKHSRG